ncbi:MAG: glutamyl-tRNA reductase [Ferruginibacter sp.]|nr:glutamyl-tRNA reductase [Ferruginibacter sp.]
MHRHKNIVISSFFIAGINYKKTDASIRSRFAINPDQYENIISAAPSFGIKELFVLSTCNRTEIYGFADDSNGLAALLCTQTEGSLKDFFKMAYVRSGVDAIEHLFNVAAGLDSQILGDYEIIGQIKQSAKFSRQRNFLGSYLERMINEVLRASKKIRTNTAMSGGTVSVSFAAVQCIREKILNTKDKKILLLGTGKIGSNTCKNLADYLPETAVTLINRSVDKALSLAEAFNFKCDHIGNLQNCIDDADIILVATNANEPLIFREHFTRRNKKLIIDLSLPCNVDASVKELEYIHLVNVDELSKIKDETLLKRSAEIPKVKIIIAEHVAEFIEWHEMRRHVPVLQDVKNKLLTIHNDSIFDPTVSTTDTSFNNRAAEQKIQKVINGMALKMRTQNQRGCNYIEAINDFISTASIQ